MVSQLDNTTGKDPRCPFCHRPVVGTFVHGNEGRYHPECTRPPEALRPDPTMVDVMDPWRPVPMPFTWTDCHCYGNVRTTARQQ